MIERGVQEEGRETGGMGRGERGGERGEGREGSGEEVWRKRKRVRKKGWRNQTQEEREK